MKKVLDGGYIRLIDSMGDDLSIVRSARVSYNAVWRSGLDGDKDEKLIQYLMENGHNTPFESVEVQFEIKAPIFIIRQWQRHRTMSYNEVSARYTELPSDYYLPELSKIGVQSKNNKQCRDIKKNENSVKIFKLIKEANINSFDTYQKLLYLNCPKELARSVLPTGMYTKMFVKANLNNWFRFLKERLHSHAQYEIRVYAQEILVILETIAPVAVKAFKNTLAVKNG